MKNSKATCFFMLLALILLVFACMFGAHLAQTDFGKIMVTKNSFSINNGILFYKLYRPKLASAENKLPGVLLLHGYQNDSETSSAFAIELARRGAVVLSLDEYGHGFTNIGMRERGFVNQKLSVPYGTEIDKDISKISGPDRYKIMMNFSNMNFFDSRYTHDDAGNTIIDSSMGGNFAYTFLRTLPYVDASRLAVSGHSMGTWSTWSVAAEHAGLVDEQGLDISPKALVLQCGEIFTKNALASEHYYFNNVLLLQAKYEEFSYFRDFQNNVDEKLLKSDLRAQFLGTQPQQTEWNKAFGSFSEGTARRMELLHTNHRLVTANSRGIGTTIEWLEHAIGLDSDIASTNFLFKTKDSLQLLASLFALCACIVLMEILLSTSFFAQICQNLSHNSPMVKTGFAWWKGAIITMLIALCTYPFMTQLGHGLLPLPENIFRMTVGNGFVAWYSLLIIVMLATSIVSKKKSSLSYADLGLALDSTPHTMGWGLLAKSALLSFIMFGFFYVLTVIMHYAFSLDFRFIWPFFKVFNTIRFGQFLVYLPIFVFFFILNNSKIFAQMRVKSASEIGIKAFFASWWRYAILMVGGIFLLALIEYLPFFAGIGPGVDLLFTPLFGGPFISLLIVFIPQVLVFSLICTYTYRRTGNIYTGAIFVSILASWVVTAGSSLI